jgi:peptide-N4-(N-acetyl-beta-glucosaminyl)asparagine amidase
MYEDSTLKQKALNAMPVERFKSEAQAKLNSYLRLNLDNKPFDLNDFLLLELLQWFKNDFFKWINQPDCDYCHSNQKMTFQQNDRALGTEAVWLAGNVEVYK